MQFSRTLTVIDSHTAGTPTRTVVGGMPNVQGRTMAARQKYFKKHHDELRSFLMQEPRGNDGIAAFLLPPLSQKADYAMIMADYRGYVDMCLHGTIGVVTTLLESGYPIRKSPQVTLETVAGQVEGTARIENGKVADVTVANVPSFLYRSDEFNVPGFGKVKADIAFGGNFYVLLESSQIGLKITRKNLPKIMETASKLLPWFDRNVPTRHPLKKDIKGILGISFYENLNESDVQSRNVMVGWHDLIDRSPCGTGTCARLAALHASGEIKVGKKFVYESIIGTRFSGVIRGTSDIEGITAVNPEVTGSAFITGFSTVVSESDDPVQNGFLLK